MDGPAPTKERRNPRDPQDPGRAEDVGFLRSMTQVDWLALLVVVFYLIVDDEPLPHPALVLGAMLVFGVFAALVRLKRFPLRSTRGRIALDVVVTILFISLMASESGGGSSPLVNLYLLPIVLAGVTLGPRGTLAVVVAVGAAYLALFAHGGDLAAPPAVVSARLFGELAPYALVAYLTQRLTQSILSARRRIAELAERDGLTGLVNLRSFKELLGREHAARAGVGSYAVLMIDVDRLKHFNDTWGHEAGNAAIVHVAEAIRRAVRSSDIAARYGGDEFAVFLPEASPQVAENVAQRIRNSAWHSLFHPGDRAQRVTVSVGAGGYPQDGRTLDEILAAADQRMYQDKKLRRREGDPEPPRPRRL